MIGQMAIAIALPGFNDLGRSVTPIFFCCIISSTDFFLVERKDEENLSTVTSLNFLPNAPSNSVLFSSSLFCATVTNAS